MINDISGLRFDPVMAGVAAAAGVPVILMHAGEMPHDLQNEVASQDLIREVKEYLRGCMDIAGAAGIERSKLVLDPGIGFGKTFDDNLRILRDLAEFREFQMPILVGLSRKAFIGKILEDAGPGERLEGTAAAVAISVMNGADIVRVHDVREMAGVVKVANAIKRGRMW
jgi:dihydropteroate synthase